MVRGSIRSSTGTPLTTSKAEGGAYPSLEKVRELKKTVRTKLERVAVA